MSFARAEVRHHNGVPTIFVDGQPLHRVAMTGCALDEPAAARALIEDGADALLLPIEAGTHCWMGEGSYDWSHAEKRLAFLEQHGGGTRWLIRLRLDLLAPWFAQAYPFEVHSLPCTSSDSQSWIPDLNQQSAISNPQSVAVANIASPIWNEKVCGLVRDFVSWLRATRWAPRTIGFMLNAGSNDEWLILDSDETTRGRYHPVYTREFRNWLRRTYREEATLRAAWNDPSASFETATCPTGHMRNGSHARGPFSLRDPAAERPAIDYYRFLSTTLADHFAAVCRAAKEAAGGPILCGGFGDPLWRESGVYSYAQERGHCLTQRLKECPWVDFLSLSDLGRRAASEVALVCSEETPLFQAAMSEELLGCELACHRPLLLGAAQEQWRLTGVAFDTYELHDLARPDFPGGQYRLFIFVNCARVSERAAEGVRRWRNDDRVFCWTYAPAVLDERRLDPAIGSELIGMRLGWKRERRQIRVLVDDSGYVLTRGGEQLSFGTEGSVGPVFFADDPEACVFGRLRDGGEAAFALRHHDGWKSVYLAMLNFGPQLLRNLARFAGARVEPASDATHSPSCGTAPSQRHRS